MEYTLGFVGNIGLTSESVAFLHAKGGGWFNALRTTLRQHGFDFAEIARQPEWPTGSENIALCTFTQPKAWNSITYSFWD